MNEWQPSEDEEVNVALYSLIRRGLVQVHGVTPTGEVLYELTPEALDALGELPYHLQQRTSST